MCVCRAVCVLRLAHVVSMLSSSTFPSLMVAFPPGSLKKGNMWPCMLQPPFMVGLENIVSFGIEEMSVYVAKSLMSCVALGE